LRAFVDWMIDILNEKTDFDGDVRIVQPIRHGTGELVNSQDGLYHVLLQGISQGREVNDTRLISCVAGVLNPFTQWEQYLKEGENAELQFIISNTTEAGIAFSAADDTTDRVPETFPGKLTLLLYRRYNHFQGAGDKGVVFLPCELIEKNGETLKDCIERYIAHWNLPAQFKSWVSDHCLFCNTLVDRIVTGFPKEHGPNIQQSLGYEDQLLVQAEPFHLWVIEGNERVRALLPFAQTDLNVKFAPDLTPYRSRKVRILNGTHTAMVPVAYLRGLRTVREAIEDPVVHKFVENLIFQEIIPTLDLPETELRQFANDVLERFRNPFIRHELLSIALNSVSKFRVRVLPSLLAYHERRGKLPENLTFSLAALIAFYRGALPAGEKIPLNDSAEIIRHFERSWDMISLEDITRSALENPEFREYRLADVPGLLAMAAEQLSLIQSGTEKLSSPKVTLT